MLAFTAQVGSKIDLASGWILEMNNLRKKTGHESRNIINLFLKKKKILRHKSSETSSNDFFVDAPGI